MCALQVGEEANKAIPSTGRAASEELRSALADKLRHVRQRLHGTRYDPERWGLRWCLPAAEDGAGELQP